MFLSYNRSIQELLLIFDHAVDIIVTNHMHLIVEVRQVVAKEPVRFYGISKSTDGEVTSAAIGT